MVVVLGNTSCFEAERTEGPAGPMSQGSPRAALISPKLFKEKYSMQLKSSQASINQFTRRSRMRKQK